MQEPIGVIGHRCPLVQHKTKKKQQNCEFVSAFGAHSIVDMIAKKA